MIFFEVARMARCAVCAAPVIYLGPIALRDSKRLCSDVCSVIDDQITPGCWVDAGDSFPDDPPDDRPVAFPSLN
ncbi:MAG: hypothetical protein JWM87_1798 [Candidatus Eremiobacteraeota bacterium]|nr:hypothetical protein [Candidatus Eremiobacteraeota bacterium]